MSQADFAVNFFVALFALLDPIGNVALFAAATAGVSPRHRAQIAAYIAAFVVGFLTFFYFTGLSLLEFFGISMPAFRIAGGIILFLMGLQMVRGELTPAAVADAAAETAAAGEPGYARRRFERMIVPFAMPLLIGPGAISTVVIYSAQARVFGLPGAAVGVGVIATVALATLLIFMATPQISRVLGSIGITIVGRVLGLILCAMAVQFILAGLDDSTIGVINHETAAPYGK